MATDERVSEVIGAVRAHLRADAAVTIAALGETSDDAYLATARAAQEHYAPTSGLTPISGRWAVPGGSLSADQRLSTAGIAPAAVFAIGWDGDDAVALVGSARDAKGSQVAEALRLRDLAGSWLIVGRASRDWSETGMRFRPTGGENVGADRIQAWTVVQAPAALDEAELIKGAP